MNRLVTSVLAASAMAGLVGPVQGRGAQSERTRLKACSILTRDLVEPFVQNKQLLDLLPPEEETSPTYTACEYGSVRLQHYEVRPGVNQTAPPAFQPLSGVGEKAFFRANGNNYAELMAWSGAHHITLQVSVPQGSTAEAMRPKTAALANAILQKLR